MAKINVLVQAKAHGGNVHSWLKTSEKLAGKFAESAERASVAMGKLGRTSLGAIGAAGGGGRARAGQAKAGGGRAQSEAGPSIDKALREATRSRERAWRAESRDAERQVAAMARAGQQRVRSAQRSAKALESLTDAQMVEREIQNEINARRRRAARTAAKSSLGADPTARKMSGIGRIEMAENLAAASGEFEALGSKVEGGLRESFRAFSDYEKKVAEIGTITEDVSLKQIDAIAKEAVSTFGGDPMRQAEALQKVMSMGAATAADAQAQLMAANKLGIAGSANVADSVMAISKSVANFKGTDAQEAADAIFAVTQASSAEVGDLAQALPRVAAGAAMAGLTLQETVGTIGQLSNKLPDANQAVTGMIQMLSNIQKPTKRAREEADRLGIDFSTAGIQAAGGWEQFLLKLRAAEGYDEDTLAKLFDSSEARIAVAAIVDDMEGLRKNLGAQEKAAGGTEKAFAKMTDTTAHKAALLEGQFEMLKIQAGEQLVPVMLGLGKAAMPMIGAMSTLIQDNPTLIGTLAKFSVALVVGSKAMGGITSAMSMWHTLAGITAGKTDALGKAVEGSTGKITGATKATSGLARVGMSLPGIFMAAQAGILAFSVVMDTAQKPLKKYEERLGKIEEQQKNISFWRDPTAREKEKFETERATKLAELQKQLEGSKSTTERAAITQAIADTEAAQLGPVEKSENELLMERRNRLIEQVNASRTAARQARGGAAAETFMGGDTIEGLGQVFGGIVNRATGVSDELARRQEQDERDLARFDQQYGEQLDLGAGAFTTEASSEGFTGAGSTLAVLQELVAATQMVATNTQPKAPVGGSIEAGLS